MKRKKKWDFLKNLFCNNFIIFEDGWFLGFDRWVFWYFLRELDFGIGKGWGCLSSWMSKEEEVVYRREGEGWVILNSICMSFSFFGQK
jgi:hypothetical protein